MKKGFTRTYWFLLAVWLLSSLAVYGLRWYIDAAYRYPADYLDWLRDPEASLPVLDTLVSSLCAGFMALHTAARWYIALHHGLLPYLVPAGLTCVYSWWTSFYALTTPGPDVPLWRLLVNAVLLPVAAAAVLFLLAKGLRRLCGGREWLAALVLAAFYLLTDLLWHWRTLPAYLPPAGIEAVLRAAACLLLVLCVHRWWERKPEAAEPAAPAPPEDPDSLS